MLVYAETNDLLTGNWLLEVPDNAINLVRHASVLVRSMTRLAMYDTLPSGLPEDDDKREAMRDAVCAQVAMWTKSGIDPDAGVAGRTVAVQSQSADGGSVTYANLPSADEVRAATTSLCPLAVEILREGGLLSSRPHTW